MTEQSELLPASAGELLARERHRQRLTRTEVARALHLPESILRAIEEDRVEHFAPIYLRGYLANYARHLGMDPEPLLESLRSGGESELQVVLPTRMPGYGLEKWLKIATYALVTTVIVPPLIMFFVMGGSRIFDREVVTAEPLDSIAPDSERSVSRVSGRIAQALNLEPPEGERSGQSHLSASTLPLQAIRPMRESEPGAITPGAITDAPAEPRTDEDGNLFSALDVQMSDDSWVEIVAADGRRLEFDLLRSGMQRSYQGVPPFRVLLGRANAVHLSVDGEPVLFDGHDRGDVAQFRIEAPARNAAPGS